MMLYVVLGVMIMFVFVLEQVLATKGQTVICIESVFMFDEQKSLPVQPRDDSVLPQQYAYE